MYVNLDGYNKIMDRSAKAAQLELENKRQAERDDWDRQSQAELVDQRQRAAEMRKRVQAQAREMAGAADDQGYDITPITGGMAPPITGGMAPPSVNRQALDAYTPEQGAPAPSTGLVKRAGFKAPSHMDDELKLIRGQMELAGVSGDNRQLIDSQKAYLLHKKQRTAMAIANHFDNADDAELDRIANTITQDKTNKITSVRDPKTGYFLLRSEEGTQRLNRKEMRDYLIAKANGNLDEMSKAQESAMKRVETDNGRVVQMTAPNNQAISYANNDAKAAASLAIQRERAGAAAKAERMGLVRQYSDPKTGEVKEMYPVTGRDGKISWEEVPTPEGMAPYRAPKPFNQKDYADTIKTFVDAGFPKEDATMQADQLYGRTPVFDSKAAAAQLKAMEEAKKRGGAQDQYGPPMLPSQAIPMHILREAGGDANRARAMMQAAEMQALGAALSQSGRGLSTTQRPPTY